MRRPLLVALYGRSLILDTVGRRLERDHGLRVVTFDAAPGDDWPTVHPDVLVVDLGRTSVASALDVVGEHAGLLLVGIDASGSRLLVLAGPQARAMSTRDLAWLIERHAGSLPQPA